MKRFRLYVASLSLALMAACTDYVGEIEDAHNEYAKANSYTPKDQSSGSGCVCIANNPLYDFNQLGDATVSWQVMACNQLYQFAVAPNYYTSTVNDAGALISNSYYIGWDYKVEMLLTVGGPYFQTSVGIDISVLNSDGSFVETLTCDPTVVMGVSESADATPVIWNVSSSSTAKSSSSTAKSSSSSKKSSYLDEATYACGDLWCGFADTEGRVLTGYEDVNEYSGYWYTFSDKDDLGTSTITFPSDVEENVYGNFFGPLIEAYGGIKAEIMMGAGYDYPYVGFAFNVVGDEIGADIDDWNGFCLVYKSEIGFSIELGVENERTVTGYNNYKATVPKSSNLVISDFPWAKFKQEANWGETVSQAEVLEKVASIRLKFRESAGNGGDFFLQSIGRWGTCNNN